MSALGGIERRRRGRRRCFLLDCESFDPLGAWEVDRGPQKFAYDFWWHLGYDTLLTSEWGSPSMFEQGVVPEKLLGREYGHAMHVWDLRHRNHLRTLDLGDEHQMVLELRPAHDPRKAYGFVGVVVSVEDLSASVWLWHRDGGDWRIQKVITIPAEPADAELLPPLLKGFGAVPPLVTDINLSLDDSTLYVSCWGTGDFHAVRRQRPVRAEADRQGAAGRNRCAGLAPAGRHAHRRAADGRGEPRRQAHLRVELALLVVGHPVLPVRPRRLGGQARRRAGRRHHARSGASW